MSGTVDVLPRSSIGVDGPLLVMAPPANRVITVDVRWLDGIELHEEGLLLIAEDLEIVVGVADGRSAAARLVAQLAPHTRSGQIATPAEYEYAKEWMSACERAERPPALRVGADAVTIRGDYIQLGVYAYRISEVREYALRGANIPLGGGGLLQAALALLVVAIENRTVAADVGVQAKRLARAARLMRL